MRFLFYSTLLFYVTRSNRFFSNQIASGLEEMIGRKDLTNIHNRKWFLFWFDSFVPDSYKYAIIFTLLYRAFKLCSNFEQFHQEMKIKRTFFRKSCYPVNFTDFCVKKYQDNLYVKKKVHLLVLKIRLTFVLLFLGKKS